MAEKLRTHITAPYRAYNGATITCQAHIDTYNAIQDDINIWIRDRRPIPEWLLNWSHRHFVMMAQLAK